MYGFGVWVRLMKPGHDPEFVGRATTDACFFSPKQSESGYIYIFH